MTRGQGVPFQREYFLVSGEDKLGRGYRRSPFDAGPGYTGDPSVEPSSGADMRVVGGAVGEGEWVKAGGAMVRSESALAKGEAAKL